jgi:hypothetical protein
VNPLAIALAAFLVMLMGATIGILLRRNLPAHHLNEHSKDIVRLGSALLATIVALVLGLLITSAKNTFDTQRNEVRQITAKVVLLDNQLKRYGPEAHGARELQRQALPPMIERIWGERAVKSPIGAPYQPGVEGNLVYAAIEELQPKNEVQRSLKFHALQTTTAITEARVLLFEQSDEELPATLLAMLVFWLTILFVGFTLFSPVNPTNGVALAIIAFSASGAIFLILEMSNPFTGLMKIPMGPLRDALGMLASN